MGFVLGHAGLDESTAFHFGVFLLKDVRGHLVVTSVRGSEVGGVIDGTRKMQFGSMIMAACTSSAAGKD